MPPPAEIPAPVHPQRPSIDVPAEVKGEEIVITLGDRRYRVRGLAKNLSYASCKVNLMASRGDGFHVDTLDLYAARQRTAVHQAGRHRDGAERGCRQARPAAACCASWKNCRPADPQTLEPKKPRIAISDEDRAAALELLERSAPAGPHPGRLRALRRGGRGDQQAGCAISPPCRALLEAPLAVMVQSSSAAGKSSLMEAVLALRARRAARAVLGHDRAIAVLHGRDGLKNKMLAIVEEEGAQRAAYALKLLQSEGALTIASTGKDPATGQPGHASIPRRRPGDDLPHHDRHRHR